MAMACMHMAVLQALISILFLVSMAMAVAGSAAAAGEEAPSGTGYQFELIHVDANGNFSREELIRRAVNRTRLRVAMLSAEEDDDTHSSPAFSGSFSMPVESSPYNYLMELKMGSTVPGTTFLAVADTGSELVWTSQMKMCIGSPSFSITKSSCSRDCKAKKKQCNLCMVDRTYGGGKTMKGFEGMETLALPTGADEKEKKATRVALVCATEWSDGMLPASAQGIVGLNRGPESLVKQLGVTKFSYCLKDPLNPKQRSPLWFGDVVLQPAAGGEEGLRSTRLVDISTELSGLVKRAKGRYYVELDGICVQHQCSEPLKQDDFKYKSQDKGLMMVDSGCTYTHLDTKVFEVLKNLLLKVVPAVKLDPKMKRTGEKYCFDEPPTVEPEMMLRFPGADLHLPWDKYVSKDDNDLCLDIVAAKKSILGNIQQRNMYMLYDLAQEKLSFKSHDCTTKL